MVSGVQANVNGLGSCGVQFPTRQCGDRSDPFYREANISNSARSAPEVIRGWLSVGLAGSPHCSVEDSIKSSGINRVDELSHLKAKFRHR
jgi:hypothetical protein